jgi:hypothetical protein
MKLTFEIVAIWTGLNFIVGIPVWMLVKLRDRREIFEKGIDWEGSCASEANPGLSNPGAANSGLAHAGLFNPALPLVGAGSLVPGAGSAMQGAVHRTSTDHRSVTDI